MTRMMIGAAMGMMAGVALMMSPAGRDVRRGVCKALKMAKKMM